MKTMDKLKAFFAGLPDKKSRLLLVLGIGGMLLIFLSGLLPERKNEPTEAVPGRPEVQSYGELLSEQLTSFVGSMEGAGQTRVLVMLENDGEDRYLKEENTDRAMDADGSAQEAKTEEYLLTDNEKGRSAVQISYSVPEIRGVAVICEGGDIPAVQAQITDTLSALLHISSARISVSKIAK